jgi:probable F420-dependent oxidoreductase
MRFGLQLRADDPATVADEARRAEALGFDIVLVADHVGSDWSPLLSLLAASVATTTVRLGTFVLNAGLHHPLMLAREVATLDHFSAGRVELGLGAGHTRSEFAAAGVPFAPARDRKARLAEFVEIVRALLDGETVDHHGDHFTLTGASTGRAAQDRLPILVGGSGRSLLTHAARHADIVGFTGLGRTLPDGHRHAARFQPETLEDEVGVVRQAAGEGAVELNVLVQVVEITDDRRAAAAAIADRVEDLTVEDALATPFLALGTHDEIAEHVRSAYDRWGISYFVVREADAFAPVMARLRSAT